MLHGALRVGLVLLATLSLSAVAYAEKGGHGGGGGHAAAHASAGGGHGSGRVARSAGPVRAALGPRASHVSRAASIHGQRAAARTSLAQASRNATTRAPSAQALVRSPTGGTRAALRNAALADPAVARTLADPVFAGGYVGAPGFVLGWFGPVFWPFAAYDLFNFIAWPYAYDMFWPYAYDDVYAGWFGPEMYAYSGRRRGARDRALANSNPNAQICTEQTPGLIDWPLERIAQTVQPNESQRAALDALKDAAAQAVEKLRSSCPTDLPATPMGRLQAAEARIATMRDAVMLVHPALDAFYGSLSEEQKASLNAVTADADKPAARRRARGDRDMAKSCKEARDAAFPLEQIERVVRPTEAQRPSLEALRTASNQARALLDANCTTEQALTPPDRIAMMEKRLNAMLEAAQTMRAALNNFYDGLSAEQKARFNMLGARGVG